VAGIEESSVRALAKLERLLPSRLRRRVGTLVATMVTLPGPGTPVDAGTLTAIAAACRDHEQLRFGYRAHDGADTFRLTEPHRLVSSGRRWYLLAWDAGRRDWRTFRVDQMDLRLPAGPRFTPRELSDEQVIVRLSRGLATATWRYRARVTVHAPAGEIAGRLPAAITVEPDGPDRCVIEAGSDTPQMLALYLGMLDADFTVDESAAPELAECLGALAARYTRASAARSG
jgi:predicted DNA-binding transcriptional regulator YafY